MKAIYRRAIRHLMVYCLLPVSLVTSAAEAFAQSGQRECGKNSFRIILGKRFPVSKNKHLALIASSLLLLFLGMPTLAQNVCYKKPYQQWSYDEAVYIIAGSPWAKFDRLSELTHLYSANIRLHSALPIRQALLRIKQTRMNYDKLSATDKLKFDSAIQESLECPDCAKYYILTLSIRPTDQKILDLLTGWSLDKLTPYIFLANDKGDRRKLVKFIPPTGGGDNALFFKDAVFYFERYDEQGKPLITMDNKKLYFSIDEKVFKGKNVPSIRKVTFEVSKLVCRSEIVF